MSETPGKVQNKIPSLKGTNSRLSEWNSVPLGNLTEKIGSGATPTGGSNAYKESGISLIRSQNVLDLAFSSDGLAFIDDEQAAGLNNVTVKEQDVLLNITGDSVARSCMVPKAVLPARVNQHVSIIRAKPDRLDSRFLLYYLQQAKEELLMQSEIGATRRALTKGMLEQFPISLPPIDEQRAIAEVLSSLDDKIDLLHRQNKTLERLAETLFRQWFIEQADPSWPEVRLGDLLETIESGSRPKGGIDPDLKKGVPSLGAESINGLGAYEYSKTKYVTPEFFKSMRRGKLSDYDVLIYKDGAYVGRKGMFGRGFPFLECAVNEHVFRLRSNKKANQLYLYFALEPEELAQLNANSAQPGLNQEALRTFEIPLPSKDVLMTFEATVKPWIDKIFENCKQARMLSRTRDSLLPKLMSGEVMTSGFRRTHNGYN